MEKNILEIKKNFYQNKLKETMEICSLHYQSSSEMRFSMDSSLQTILEDFLFTTSSFSCSSWTKENIFILAQYLMKHPKMNSIFIFENTFHILAQLLGHENYFVFQNHLENKENPITKNLGFMPSYFKFTQSVGLRHLAIFSSLIEELMKMGVDLESIPFSYSSSFSPLTFQEDIHTLFSFHTVSEFFKTVIFLIRDYPIEHEEFNLDWIMINPTDIDFNKRNYLTTAFYAYCKAADELKHFWNFKSKTEKELNSSFIQKISDKVSSHFVPFFTQLKMEEKNVTRGCFIEIIPYLKNLIKQLEEKSCEEKQANELRHTLSLLLSQMTTSLLEMQVKDENLNKTYLTRQLNIKKKEL